MTIVGAEGPIREGSTILTLLNGKIDGGNETIGFSEAIEEGLDEAQEDFADLRDDGELGLSSTVQ